MVRVLIVDDHKLVRDGLKLLLSTYDFIEVAGEVEDGTLVCGALEKLEVDVVLMDINMPDMNGIQATEEVMNTFPEAKILALSMHDDEGSISRILKAGAMGYVMKNTDHGELAEAIKSVGQGNNYFSKEASDALLAKYMNKNSGSKSGKSHNSLTTMDDLTSREIEVIKLIAREFTNKEISEKLFISARTVDTHRRNLLQKLGCKNTAGLVRFAVENNLLDDI